MEELKKAREIVEEPGTVDNPPETAVTKGRRKTNSTKRDKKIGKSSGLGSGSGSGSGSGPSPRGRERVDELIRKTNWEEGSTPADYWIDTPDHLYVIANTFNLCVVFLARLGSTTVLPLEHFIHSLGWHKGSYRYVKATGNILEIPYPRVTAGRGTNPCNHPCRKSMECSEHWSMTLSISAKVPRATVPPQKYSLTHTSCCLEACVPLGAG
ncbi:hypothetical protein M9H77_33735 [Catharanthus roseus]|uniref:Uncharacterized protein n=1 Tax=Catharanthus roseus TaxID=4058 RepID=A0ACB9ZJZ4_CATRO|nr:hypothetical protein M9H77_33735 [Catharanthus roseus]